MIHIFNGFYDNENNYISLTNTNQTNKRKDKKQHYEELKKKLKNNNINEIEKRLLIDLSHYYNEYIPITDNNNELTI